MQVLSQKDQIAFCNKYFTFSSLDVELFATTGGHKEIVDQNNNKKITTTFTGVELSQKVRIVFDINRPTHCSSNSSCGENDWGWPLHVQPDITDVSIVDHLYVFFYLFQSLI